ncbi:hypothetical protein [Maribacter litoralis]|uniref:Uncharacterized protein n=1 Tax=Maribacter litoralis TaxID=2059726 RepID=A0A653NBJ0_9FLAO|nr:hypothetical protein [Maribacter litoralis]VXB14884.1 conserved hypothetical protein [Maribacter litoralis]
MQFNSSQKFKNSNIYRLSELKPAATKLILEPKTELIELLKLTLFDLTLKQVLRIKKTQLKSHPRDPYLREYVTVETGKNFTKYKPNKFEEYFTGLIDEDSYFKLKPYLRAIFKKIPSEYQYKKEIVRDLKLKSYFKSDLVSSIFSLFKTNFKGNNLKKELQEYLDEVDENIVTFIENEPNKALELILFLQGNIFLLKNLKFELLEKLKSISPVISNNNDDDFLNDWYWIDFIYDPDLSFSDLFTDISEMFHTIDDYFDFDSGGDWGGDYDFDID